MEWKEIEGFEGLYEVSENGLIRSLGMYVKRGKGIFYLKGRVLKYGKDKDGYLQINLFKNGKCYARKVHRLVAIAFIARVENKEEVNHIDGNKNNPSVTNLEWCNRTENRLHAVITGLQVTCAEKAVNQFSLDGILIATFKSQSEAARKIECFASRIREACLSEKPYRGFLWKLTA